jgi:hypothetical protein
MIGTAGLASIALMLVILARLTKRWEAVTRARSHYRLFYFACGLVALAALARLVRIGYLPLTTLDPDSSHPANLHLFLESGSWFYFVFYHLPLALAMTLSLILAWKNWGWLLREKGK